MSAIYFYTYRVNNPVFLALVILYWKHSPAMQRRAIDAMKLQSKGKDGYFSATTIKNIFSSLMGNKLSLNISIPLSPALLPKVKDLLSLNCRTLL